MKREPKASLDGHEGGNAGDSQGEPKGARGIDELSAEGMEGRGWAKGNAGSQNTLRAQNREQGVLSAWDRIGQAANALPFDPRQEPSAGNPLAGICAGGPG